MTDDNSAGALDGRPAAPQTSPLTVLAWLATGLYGLLVAILLFAGLAATTSHESAAMFAMAVVSGIALAIMLAIMCTGGRRSFAGRWICILLGSLSLLLLLLLVTS